MKTIRVRIVKNKLFKKIKRRVKEIEPRIIETRREIHRHPEPAFKEYRTADLIANKLKAMDAVVETGIAGTGVTALFTGGMEGPTVALRADMDALKIEEQGDKPYRSREDGMMHACGHDGHMAILLGVAEILQEIKDDLRGNVKLIFQPAEESTGGAKPMIEEGVLKNPEVEAVFGLHIWLDLPAGIVGIKRGPAFAAIDEFDILIKGRSAHAASPHQGVDSIVVSAEIINALQTIVSRMCEPLDPAVVTVGRIEAGTTYNVLAGSAKMQGTVRYLREETGKEISGQIENILNKFTSAHGAGYELNYRKNFPVLVNNEGLLSLIRKSAKEVVGSAGIRGMEKPTMGGEDFAYFSRQVPGFFLFLGGRNEKKGIIAPHHSPRFDFDEAILAQGTELFLHILINYLLK